MNGHAVCFHHLHFIRHLYAVQYVSFNTSLKPVERKKLLQLASLCKITHSTKSNWHRAYIEHWVVFCIVMTWKYNSLHNTDRVFTENNRAIISPINKVTKYPGPLTKTCNPLHDEDKSVFCSNEPSPFPISVLKTKDITHNQKQSNNNKTSFLLSNLKSQAYLILSVLSHFNPISIALL